MTPPHCIGAVGTPQASRDVRRQGGPTTSMISECNICHKADADTRLHRCPICHKYFCEDHAHHRSGLWFCSSGCAEYFFYSDPDD